MILLGTFMSGPGSREQAGLAHAFMVSWQISQGMGGLLGPHSHVWWWAGAMDVTSPHTPCYPAGQPGPFHMAAKFPKQKEGKLQCTIAFQANVYMMFANVPLAKAIVRVHYQWAWIEGKKYFVAIFIISSMLCMSFSYSHQSRSNPVWYTTQLDCRQPTGSMQKFPDAI